MNESELSSELETGQNETFVLEIEFARNKLKMAFFSLLVPRRSRLSVLVLFLYHAGASQRIGSLVCSRVSGFFVYNVCI